MLSCPTSTPASSVPTTVPKLKPPILRRPMRKPRASVRKIASSGLCRRPSTNQLIRFTPPLSRVLNVFQRCHRRHSRPAPGDPPGRARMDGAGMRRAGRRRPADSHATSVRGKAARMPWTAAVQVTGRRVGADGTGRRPPPDQRLAVGPVHVQAQHPELVALGAAEGIVLELDRDDDIGVGRRSLEALLLQERIGEELDIRLDEAVLRVGRRPGRPRVALERPEVRRRVVGVVDRRPAAAHDQDRQRSRDRHENPGR